MIKNNGIGPLRTVLEQAQLIAGYTMNDLTVLDKQNDPYRQDTPAGHQKGRWFKEQVDRFVSPAKKVHLRELHYLVSSSGDILKVGGLPYQNIDPDWEWLEEDCAKAGRWLGYVPHSRFIDARNEAPKIFVPDDETTIT